MFGAFVGRIPKLTSWDPQQVTHILVLRGLNNLRIDPGMSTCKLLKPQQLWEVRMWGLRHDMTFPLKEIYAQLLDETLGGSSQDEASGL